MMYRWQTLLSLVVVALVTSRVPIGAQQLLLPSLVPLDNFESYADSNDLASVWVKSAGSGTLGLSTNIMCEGTKAMRIAYAVGAAPNTNTYAKTFASPQDWSSFNTVTFYYGGASGNSSDSIIFRLLDHLGGTLGTFIIPGGTAVPSCTNVALDISKLGVFTNTVNQTDLRDVSCIVIGVVKGTSGGSGTVYFDNLVVGNNGNVSTNAGFQDMNDDGLFGDGWSSFGTVQFGNFLTNGNPGNAIFHSDTNGNSGGLFWPATPAVSGTKYRLTVDANCESLWRADTRFGVEFLADDNVTVITQRIVYMFAYTNAPHVFKTYSMTAVVPDGVAAIRPVVSYFNSTNSAGASKRCALDNVCLAVETNRVLSIFGASIHKGFYSYGTVINYLLGGSYGRSFGALLYSNMAPCWRVDNRSISGDNTTNLNQRFYLDETPTGADVIFIATSVGNQGLHGSTNPQAILDSFYLGYSNLIVKSRANNLLPMVGCGFPRTVYTTNDYAWLKKMELLLNTLDVPSCNFLGATDNGTGNFLPLMDAGDGIHFTDAGHYELYLCFVPTVFDALMAGKTTPKWSKNQSYAHIGLDESQPAPLTFTPTKPVHSFSMSFRVKSFYAGTLASITLPNPTNQQPTIELRTTGVVYVASSGQQLASQVPFTRGWHEIMLTHQYSRTQTWLYVDSVLAGSVKERLAPVGFVLGGPGNASYRPAAPGWADYQNWFIHRSALIPDEVKAHNGGALQQSSLELYAPLDDPVFVLGGTVTNVAQSLSAAVVTASTINPQPVLPISYNYSDGSIILNYYAPPFSTNDVQRSLVPDFSVFSTLGSATAAFNGLITFPDTNPPSPTGFYRLMQR